jgi:hypothetical protein
MDNILEALRKADAKGLAPPQNWTTRAADEIQRLQDVVTRLGSMEAFEMSRSVDKNNPADKELLARIEFAREAVSTDTAT